MRKRVCVSTVVIAFVVFLAGCARTTNINTHYQQPQGYQNLFSSLSPLKIRLLNFADKREGNKEGIWIGYRKAAFNAPMGELYSERPIFDIFREALQIELNKGGHVIVTEGQDITIEGTIDKFIVYTDATMLYWDIIGETSFSLKVTKNDGSKSGLFGPYSGKSVDRTYVNPSDSLMQQALQDSLGKAMKELCSDKQLIDFNNKK